MVFPPRRTKLCIWYWLRQINHFQKININQWYDRSKTIIELSKIGGKARHQPSYVCIAMKEPYLLGARGLFLLAVVVMVMMMMMEFQFVKVTSNLLSLRS